MDELKKEGSIFEKHPKSSLPRVTKMKLRALTTRPAEFLKVSDQIGTLEAGKIIFLVVKGELFGEGEIYENWVKRTTYQN